MTIREDFIFQSSGESFEDLVARVSDRLKEMGYVHESYAQAIIDREQIYPTGLEGMQGGFAIPHAACEHCRNSTIAVVRCDPPMSFVRMDDHSEHVNCSLLLMLVIQEAKEQLPMLRRLMRSLQKPELFGALCEAAPADAAAALQAICE